MQLFLLIVLSCACLTPRMWAYPQGAPVSACSTMFPEGHEVNAQNSTPPYQITLTPSSNILAGASVLVTLQGVGTAQFEGFFIQARMATCDSDMPVGTFSTTDQTTQTLACSNMANSAITQTNSNPQSTKTFTWKAPTPFPGRIYFRATVVKNEQTFWTQVSSMYLTTVNDTTTEPSKKCDVKMSVGSASSFSSATSLIFSLIITMVTSMFL